MLAETACLARRGRRHPSCTPSHRTGAALPAAPARPLAPLSAGDGATDAGHECTEANASSASAKIIPAADLSEQISTAGTEASGTSNMKFALNGALTIGTLDGANIEIREAVGEENFIAFGMDVAHARTLREGGTYRPAEVYDRDSRVMRIVNAFESSRFCPEEPGTHAWVRGALLDQRDEYLHLADLPGYLAAHERAGEAYADPERWTRMSVLNVARIGRFSSDRTVGEYAREIWGVHPA